MIGSLKGTSREDALLDEVRATQEQFHGERYWERPVETPSTLPRAFVSHDSSCPLRSDGTRCECRQENSVAEVKSYRLRRDRRG